MKKYLSLLIYVSIAPFMIGCSDIKLTPNDIAKYSTSPSGINFCTSPATTIRSNMKFIFVVDRSGSNQNRYDENGTHFPGTDPAGDKRFTGIENFVDSFQASPDNQYLYWSMISLASAARVERQFTNDLAGFRSFIGNEHVRSPDKDGGSTNYINALDAVKALIAADIARAKDQVPLISSNYVIFFVSDGAPIVPDGNGGEMIQSQASILEDVTAIKAFEEQEKVVVEGIQMNTAYYTAPPALLREASAHDLLSAMADTGGGDFSEFGEGQNIDYSRFAIPLRVSRFALKQIWVRDVNTVWYNNKLEADTDGDGLADVLERALGSDPFAYDSDGNGVGDGVEYRITANTKPCKTVVWVGNVGHCDSTQADPYTSCRGYQVSTNPITYADTDRDYLNDCEEKLLGTDRLNADSNYDYVPDWIAFVSGIQMTGVASDLYLDTDRDGLSTYEELQRNTPPHVPNSQVPGLVQMTLQGSQVSTDATQDCYSFDAQHVAYHSANDKIRIFIFENTRSLNEKIIYRTAEQNVTPYGSVSVENEDFH